MALQTKTFTTGSFDRYTGTSNGYILDLIVTEEAVDLQANTSHVRYKLQLRSGPSNRFDWELTSTLALNGTQVAVSTAEKYLDYNATWVLLTGQADIPHNANGSLNMAFSAVVTPYGGGNQYTPPAMTLAGTMTMTDIARASAVAATSVFIENTSTISVSRKSANYTHSIHYQFGALSGYLADAVGTHSETEVKLTDTTILFPLPDTFYGQIPDSPSGICRLTCTTYQGDQQIGTPQTAEFTVTADPLRCAPVLSGTAEDIDPVTLLATEDPSVLVKGYSVVLCAANASAQKGASLTGLWVNGQPIHENALTIPQIQTADITFRATDSRGYAAEYTVPGLSLVDYTGLSATLSARRLDPTDGTAQAKAVGTWYPGTIGATANALSARCRVEGGDWMDLTPIVNGSSYTVTADLSDLDYRQNVSVCLQISDALQTQEKTVKVNRGVPVFDWGAEDFAFHVPVRFTASDGTVFTLDLVQGQLTAIIT